MFLDQELNRIQKAKNDLSLCCELRRRLIHIEFQGLWSGARRTLSTLTAGMAVAEQIIGFLRQRKTGRP